MAARQGASLLARLGNYTPLAAALTRSLMCGAVPASRTVGAVKWASPEAPRQLAGLPFAGFQFRSLFIRTEPTPNPETMMYIPGKPVSQEGVTYNFTSARDAMASPLANRLFAVDGVKACFFGADFVSVTKAENVPWAALKPEVFEKITDYYASGDPLVSSEEALAASDTAIHEDDDEVVAMIKELLETRIRPAVQEDGGDIVYKGFNEESGTVFLQMQGACSGCPSSSVTLKSGIENMLMHYIPEIKEVVEYEDDASALGQQEFNRLEQHLSP